MEYLSHQKEAEYLAFNEEGKNYALYGGTPMERRIMLSMEGCQGAQMSRSFIKEHNLLTHSIEMVLVAIQMFPRPSEPLSKHGLELDRYVFRIC